MSHRQLKLSSGDKQIFKQNLKMTTSGLEGGAQKPRQFALGALLLLTAAAASLLVRCEPSQQQHRGSSQANELGQDFSGGGQGAGLAGLDGFGGRGVYTPANAKRARKMSAFMPMRGRKDGRDLVGVDSLRGGGVAPASSSYAQLLVAARARLLEQLDNQQQQQFALRESDPNDDDATLARLISAGGAGAGNYQPRQYYARDNATPRQFYNQFQSAQLQQAERAPASLEQAEISPQYGGGGSQEVGVRAGPAATGQMMQAKLRRAFHPMRGKKSLGGLAGPAEGQEGGVFEDPALMDS